ncbi:separin [Culicoides brevitarsis]|uniref:separin n=1 Tax=Culicoides brevitarsis TaxID=469753 RepID=UPI00307B85F2
MNKGIDFEAPLNEQILAINKSTNGPVAKYNLLYQTEKMIKERDFKSVILASTEALSAIPKIKYNFNPERDVISTDRRALCPIIRNDVSKCLKKSKPEQPPSINQLFSELNAASKTLPAEWMVVQIAKRFDSSFIGATNKQITCKDTGLIITLFHYPRWELNDKRPLAIVVPPGDNDRMYTGVFEIYEALKENLMYNKEQDSGQNRQKYWENLRVVEEKLTKLVEEQEKWFGTWRFLLTGYFKKTEDKAMEAKIYAKVDQYCKQHKSSTEFRIIVSLLARRIDLMSHKALYEFCCHYSETDAEVKRLFLFLIDIQKSFKVKNPRESFPCMLVIDEILDFLLWEMLNIDQDFCRFNSFHAMMTIYTKYASEIKNGYWMTNVKDGFAIVDPENNLQSMRERMVEYLSYWMPKWKLVVGQAPTKENFTELFEKDVFVYCGHGSGFQFIKDFELMQHKIKPVTFLFGCSSGRLNSKGMWGELQGSHTYYAAGLCPAVFGMLFVVTDYLTDLMSTIILCRWLPNTDCKRTWYETFKKNWRVDTIQKLNIVQSEAEKNLCRIISDLRRETSITIRQRAAMCYRGLPVWNGN